MATQKSASVDHPAIPDLDREFHVGIARASGSGVLSACVSALHRTTEPVHYLDLSPEVGRETVRQHAATLRAIGKQDADAAETATPKHLTYLQRHLAAHVGGLGSR